MEFCLDGSWPYFQFGLEHILLEGTDHLLYLIVLCAAYSLGSWKRVLVLVTAFTLGHSLTLLLATKKWLLIDTDWIEFLIPVTILATAITNGVLAKDQPPGKREQRFAYLFALLFGLIHGLGYSNTLRGFVGEEGCLFGPLLMFNISLEIGQLVIVLGVLLMRGFFVEILNNRQVYWIRTVAIIVGCWALWMMVDRAGALMG